MNTQFSIGDIVEDNGSFLFFILNLNLSAGTCTIVRKSGKHSNYDEYLEDENTGDWDKRYTGFNVNVEHYKLVKSIQEQREEKAQD